MKKSILSEIKKNKYTSIGIIAFIVLLILVFIIYKAIMPSLGTPVYGNRLDGIEKVEITSTKINELDKVLEEESYVTNAKTNLSGKTLNTVITVKEGTKASTAKKITSKVLSKFAKDQIAYYDFQVFIKNENNKEKSYPIIAYKNKSNESFSYSQSK